MTQGQGLPSVSGGNWSHLITLCALYGPGNVDMTSAPASLSIFLLCGGTIMEYCKLTGDNSCRLILTQPLSERKLAN